MSSLMMESKVTIGVNAEIIHINLQPFLSYHVGKEVVHESLEVDGALQNPKNITVGSKSPRMVMKAAFHWSSSWIQMLL